MLQVGVHVRTGDEQVVQVDKAERQAAQYLIHEALEGLRGVAKAKWHSNEFEEAKWRDDCGLGDVVRVHGDLVVRPDEVNLRKYSAARELRSKVLNVGNGIAVRDGCGVECAIVATWSPVARRLANHVERRSPGAGGRPDNPYIHHVFKFRFGSGKAVRRQMTSTGVHRSTVGW